MDFTINGTPLFDGHSYVFWSRRMKEFLEARGFDVWHVVESVYNALTSFLIDDAGRKYYDNNAKSRKVILSSLTNSIYVKVMHCKSIKELWDKLQTFKGQF